MPADVSDQIGAVPIAVERNGERDMGLMQRDVNCVLDPERAG
jgi:hypothetical protein